MTVYEFIDSTVKSLMSDLQLISVVRIGKLSADFKSIAIRLMPSDNTYFYAGQRDVTLRYQILVKSDYHKEAIQEIEKITQYLNDYIGSMVYIEPNYVSEDEQGYIYQAAFEHTI